MTEVKYLYNNSIADLSARESIESLDTRVEALEQGGEGTGYINSLIGLGEEITFINGSYIDNSGANIASAIDSPIASSSWKHAVIDCSAGGKFYIYANSGNTPKSYSFSNSDGDVLEVSSEINLNAKNIIAPTGAAKLVINKKSNNTHKSYRGENKIQALSDSISGNSQNKNIVLTGKDNMAWSWWVYPQVFRFKRIRDKVYSGFCTADGYIGIASYDVATETVTKNLLYKSSQIDDHNASAVYVFDDGTIVCAYSSGHNSDHYLRVRRSDVAESIDRFADEIVLESALGTSYMQLLYDGGKLYMFYRSGGKNWCYRYSTDKGLTWTTEVKLITSSIQYYCIVRKTTTDGIARIIMYSNPGAGDSAIRQAFLRLDTGVLYDSDNSTILGSSNVSKDNVTVIIPVASGYVSQRLLDVAVSEINRPMILFAPYTGNNGNGHIYKIYDSGTITDIVAGVVSLSGDYFLGASWVGTDKVVVGHADSSNDIIDLYGYTNGTVTLIENVHTEARGSVPIRNARPIVDVNGGYILWVRGWYGATYERFNFDSMYYAVT